MPKSRGAQPGNKNALKHGFYSRHFRGIELSDLSAVSLTDLASEIATARILARRFLEQLTATQQDRDMDITESVAAMNALGAQLIRVSTLLKTQKYLVGDAKDSARDLIQSAIQTALQELDYHP